MNHESRNGNHYSSLRRHLLAIIVAVAMTPLLVIAAIAGYQFHTAYRHKVVDHLGELVDRHTQHIDTFLMEKVSDIRVLSAAYPPEKLMEAANSRVWKIDARHEELDHLKEKYPVISIVPSETGYELRVVAESMEGGKASPVEPNLEDAYVYFMQSIGSDSAKEVVSKYNWSEVS